jgi:hypothetical protein
MVLDEGSVKELAASPLPGRERVPMTEANRQGIVDPLTAMLFSAAAASESLPQEACQHTLPIFDGHQRYNLKLASTPLVKYLSERREMEIALASVADTRTWAEVPWLVACSARSPRLRCCSFVEAGGASQARPRVQGVGDWETGDQNSGDFIDLQGHEQNPRAQRYMMGIDA